MELFLQIVGGTPVATTFWMLTAVLAIFTSTVLFFWKRKR